MILTAGAAVCTLPLQSRDVIVYRLVTCGTVEEKIYRKQVTHKDTFHVHTSLHCTQDAPVAYFQFGKPDDLGSISIGRLHQALRSIKDSAGTTGDVLGDILPYCIRAFASRLLHLEKVVVCVAGVQRWSQQGRHGGGSAPKVCSTCHMVYLLFRLCRHQPQVQCCSGSACSPDGGVLQPGKNFVGEYLHTHPAAVQWPSATLWSTSHPDRLSAVTRRQVTAVQSIPQPFLITKTPNCCCCLCCCCRYFTHQELHELFKWDPDTLNTSETQQLLAQQHSQHTKQTLQKNPDLAQHVSWVESSPHCAGTSEHGLLFSELDPEGKTLQLQRPEYLKSNVTVQGLPERGSRGGKGSKGFAVSGAAAAGPSAAEISTMLATLNISSSSTKPSATAAAAGGPAAAASDCELLESRVKDLELSLRKVTADVNSLADKLPDGGVKVGEGFFDEQCLHIDFTRQWSPGMSCLGLISVCDLVMPQVLGNDSMLHVGPTDCSNQQRAIPQPFGVCEQLLCWHAPTQHTVANMSVPTAHCTAACSCGQGKQSCRQHSKQQGHSCINCCQKSSHLLQGRTVGLAAADLLLQQQLLGLAGRMH